LHSIIVLLFYALVKKRERRRRRKKEKRKEKIMALSIVWAEVWILSLLSWSFSSLSFHSTPRYGCFH